MISRKEVRLLLELRRWFLWDSPVCEWRGRQWSVQVRQGIRGNVLRVWWVFFLPFAMLFRVLVARSRFLSFLSRIREEGFHLFRSMRHPWFLDCWRWARKGLPFSDIHHGTHQQCHHGKSHVPGTEELPAIFASHELSNYLPNITAQTGRHREQHRFNWWSKTVQSDYLRWWGWNFYTFFFRWLEDERWWRIMASLCLSNLLRIADITFAASSSVASFFISEFNRIIVAENHKKTSPKTTKAFSAVDQVRSASLFFLSFTAVPMSFDGQNDVLHSGDAYQRRSAQSDHRLHFLIFVSQSRWVHSNEKSTSRSAGRKDQSMSER